MDDLAQLQSRVEAARDRLGGVEDDQRKYGLRLDDLVRIVEGALSRQSADLQAARIKAASLETELDDARNALSRNEVELAVKDTDLVRLEAQNEQLRSMVMTLLELVEGRNAVPMREAMVRLERGVRHLLSETTATVAKPPVQTVVQSAVPVAPPLRTPEPPATPLPSRPVLVPNQAVQGRVPPPKSSSPAPLSPAPVNPVPIGPAPIGPAPVGPSPVEREAPDMSDALIELTAVDRANAEEIVREPPEIATPVAQLMRRMSDAADL
jgi:hypothetical protein